MAVIVNRNNTSGSSSPQNKRFGCGVVLVLTQLLVGALLVTFKDNVYSLTLQTVDSPGRGLSMDMMESSVLLTGDVMETTATAAAVQAAKAATTNFKEGRTTTATATVTVTSTSGEEETPSLRGSNSGVEMAGNNNSNKAGQCPQWHTAKLSKPSLVIDKPAIRSQSKALLDQLKKYTVPSYEGFFMGDPGVEHYTLLHYLTKHYHAKDDCRHVVDIGTRYVASSLALGATGVPVKTFDIPTSQERVFAFRGKTEEEWRNQVETFTDVRIEFNNLDLLAVSDEDFRNYMSTWLISLDTHHLPYSYPFEREYLARLVAMKPKYEGIMILDDIHLNPEMKQWWLELQGNATEWGFTTYDVTSVGHSSGTGLLDFSGKVTISE